MFVCPARVHPGPGVDCRRKQAGAAQRPFRGDGRRSPLPGAEHAARADAAAVWRPLREHEAKTSLTTTSDWLACVVIYVIIYTIFACSIVSVGHLNISCLYYKNGKGTRQFN